MKGHFNRLNVFIYFPVTTGSNNTDKAVGAEGIEGGTVLEGSATVATSGVYSQRHSHRVADRWCISVGWFGGYLRGSSALLSLGLAQQKKKVFMVSFHDF